MKTSIQFIEFTRVNNDVNGNPRYVCHFLAFKPHSDCVNFKSFSYDEALKAAKDFGGKKFHNKQYGGGIVFQSYDIDGLADKITEHTGDFIQYTRKPKSYENRKKVSKFFYRKEVTNKKGELKKFFTCKDYTDKGVLFSISKNNN